jgi:hypothetical protein
MMQTLQTHISFICPSCGKNAECNVDVPEPDWSAAENMSDLSSEDQTDVFCNLCQSEFPAYVMNTSGECYVTLDDYPDIDVIAESAFFSPSPDDEWLNTDVPIDPYKIFVDSYYHLGDILAEYGLGGRGILTHSSHIINRMVFVQQISALESYLGDNLTKRVLESDDALQKLLNKDKDLKDVRLPLTGISKDPNIVARTVQKHLQKILYHNLAKVEVLYKITFDINIWPDQETKEKIFNSIVYRHDCVHRNGRNKDGEKLEVFTTEYVSDILETTLLFAKHINDSLS